MNTKALGIDWGSKKVGLAISNSAKTISFPLVCLENNDEIYTKIHEIVMQELVGNIFIGMPVHMDGSLSENCTKVKEFGDKITKICNTQVKYVDERLSTQFAHTSQVYAGSLGKQSFRAAKERRGNKVSVKHGQSRQKVNLNKLDFNDDITAACNILSLALCGKEY